MCICVYVCVCVSGSNSDFSLLDFHDFFSVLFLQGKQIVLASIVSSQSFLFYSAVLFDTFLLSSTFRKDLVYSLERGNLVEGFKPSYTGVDS